MTNKQDEDEFKIKVSKLAKSLAKSHNKFSEEVATAETCESASTIQAANGQGLDSNNYISSKES